MAGDKFDQLYNALKADGAVSGTREHFRQFVYAPGKQGYHNRKQLYDALHADGAVSSKSYEEFAQRLGLHAVNPKPQQKPVAQQKPMTTSQRAQKVAAQYQQQRQQPQRPQQSSRATASGTDYMKNWQLMHMRYDQMTPLQQVQASNMREQSRRAREQAIQQEQKNPITRSRSDINQMKALNRRFRDMAENGALAYSSRAEQEKMYDIANANSRSLYVNSPVSKSFNEMLSDFDTPDARRARAKQQREDDARTLAQYEVEGNKFVRNDGHTKGILGNDLLELVDSSMNEAQELTRQQYQQNLDKMGGIYAPQSVKEQAFRDAQTQEQVNRQNVLMNNLSSKINEIYSQKGMQRHIAESAEKLNMSVEEYVDKYVTPEIMNYAQKALTMRNQEEIMPHGALDYIAKNLSNSIIGMVLAPSVMSRDTRQRLQEGIAIADGDAEIQKVAGHKDETYRSGIGTRFASTAVNMAADSGPLAVIGAGASAAVNTGTRVLTNGLVKAGVMKAAQKLTAQQMAFKVANMTTAQKIMSGLGTRTATSSLNLAGYSGVTAALSQASTGDDTSLQAIAEAGLKGAKHGAVTGAMFGVSGAVMSPWVSKFGITGMEKSTGERLLHGTQKFGATAAGLGVEAGTMMVADNVTGDKDISFGTWLEDVVMVGAFKAGEPSNFVKMGNILHHLTHNDNPHFVIGRNDNGTPISVDIRLTPDEKNELISSASGKNLMDAFTKVDRASKTAPRDPKYKNAYTDFMNDPDVSQSTKEKVNAAMGLFNTTRGRSYRSVNDVKNKQVLEYTKNGTLLTRTSYKNADERRAILYKQKLYRDNDDMMSLIGYSKMKDMQLTDEDGNVTSLALGFLRNNGYDTSKDITDPINAKLINDLRNPNSALYLDWEKYVDENGLYGYLKVESADVVDGLIDTWKKMINDKGNMTVDIDNIMRKDPMKRTDQENKIFYRVKRALEYDLFPSWRPHADQSASQGKTVAEEHSLGTDNPDSGVVVDELRNLRNAEQALDESMDSNDVFKQTFEKLHQQGLTPAQIYDALIQNGLTQEELTPLAQYINANARVQGMQQATADVIEENVKSFVSDWSYHGTLNGQAMNGEQALYVQDSNGRTLLVGSGDVAFDQTTGRAKEGSGDMLVCFDPNTNEMVYVKADEVTLFQNQPIEQFAAEYRQRLQMKNSEPYNQAAQEQAMLDAANPQPNKQEAPQDNTTKSEYSTTKDGDLTKDDTTLTKVDTTSGKDNTTNEKLAPQDQPQSSRKFVDGTEVPMTTDSKGRPTPDYSSMTPEQSAEILKEDFGDNAEKVVDGQIQKAEKALKDAEKMKVDYTAEPNDIMDQEALKTKTVEAAKKQLDHAQNIKKAMTAKKVAETLTSDEVGAIVAEIEGNGSLEAFFNNSKAINDLVKTLVDKGIIGQNEVAQMMDSPERLSAQVREYVKNLLLGSIFKPETIRMLGIDSTVKNKAINAIRSVMDNMKLGEFSLRDEIDQAIQLLYEARQGGNKVDTLLRTPDMYVEDAAKRYPSISQMMALALEGKVADFRDLLDEYNRIAAARNTGEGNVFGEAPTKPELIKEFLDFKKWQDYGTGHSENEGGNDVSGDEKPQQEASGGNEPAEAERPRVEEADDLENKELESRIEVTDEETETPSKNGPIMKQKIVIDGDKEVMKVDEPNKKGEYTGSYYEYDGKKFGDLNEVTEYIDSKKEEGTLPILPKEENPDPKFNPIEAAAAEFKKEHPLTEDEIMNSDLDDLSKDIALDYLNGEVTDDLHRAIYESIYTKIHDNKVGIEPSEEPASPTSLKDRKEALLKRVDSGDVKRKDEAWGMLADAEELVAEYYGIPYDEYGGRERTKSTTVSIVLGYVRRQLDKITDEPVPVASEKQVKFVNTLAKGERLWKAGLEGMLPNKRQAGWLIDAMKALGDEYLLKMHPDEIEARDNEIRKGIDLVRKFNGAKPFDWEKEAAKIYSTDPMEGIKSAANGYEKEKVSKTEPVKSEVKTADDAAVSASNKKVNDLWKELMNAGKDEMSASFIGLNSKQLEVLPKLVSAMAENAYLRIKRGMHNLEDVVKEMRKEFAPAAKVFKKEDVDAIYEQMMNIRYRDGEQRMSLKDWADYYEKTSPKHQENLVGDSKDAEERKQKENIFINRIQTVLSMGEFKTGIAGMRKIAEDCGLEGVKDTDLQELVETAVVGMARRYATSKAMSDDVKFAKIKLLYNRQPSLNQRDSERVMKQQYSTPVPYAYLADMYVKGKGKVIESALEPSAGNGMLTIGLPMDKVHVNDIDAQRLENLRRQGFKNVTSQDGTQPFADKDVDVVVTNPPFGSATPKEYDGYKISSLEGQMAINALDSMKDDGRAAIIIGGKTEYAKNGSLNPKDKVFLGYLYSHYNVEDVINVDGSLYAKQGTSYPTRIILINGRRLNENAFPPVKDKARAETVKDYDELYKRIEDDIHQSAERGHGLSGDNRVQRPERGESNKPSVTAHDSAPNKERVRELGQRESLDKPSRNDRPHGAGMASESMVEKGGKANGGADGEIRPGDNGHKPGGMDLDEDKRRSDGGNVGGQRAEGLRGGDGSGNVAPRQRAKRQGLTTEKVQYVSKSRNPFSLHAVMPADQAEAVQKNLDKLGDVDQFLVDELGYNDKDDMYKALSSEQADSVALAINQMKQGNAFIIGDQTGIGKGRQGAALIRYAVKQGSVPVYLTQDAPLLSTVYRDTVDIGSKELRPFVIASDKKQAAITDQDGNLIYDLPSSAEKKRVFDYIKKYGKLPKEYDYVLTTYKQFASGTTDYENGERTSLKLNKGQRLDSPSRLLGQERRDVVEALMGNGYLILDECHNASGDSGIGHYFQHIVGKAKGVTFISATFAKRPDNMPIYAMRTAMSKAGMEASDLIEAIRTGGTTLQEIMSQTLTESGQMIRRERDMTGVSIDYVPMDEAGSVEEQKTKYDSIIDIFNDIIDFQKRFVDSYLDTRNEELADIQSTITNRKGTKALGIKNQPFASKTFNTVRQLLLGIKAPQAVKRAIECLEYQDEQSSEKGIKPIIFLENTMESNYKDDFENDVDMESPDFGTVLKKGLEGVLRYTQTDAKGKESKGSLSLADLGPEAEARYNEIMNHIAEVNSGMFISPIDYIKHELEKKGYRVGELTGREFEFVFNEDGTVRKQTRVKPNKKDVARKFNNGEIDVIIANKTGATGIDLHAGLKFKDQRPRRELILQNQLNIGDEVQAHGRADRTNQKYRGQYEYILSMIPAEQRLFMMLKSKLKSLYANTTSSQKSKFNEMEVADIINKYGDKVVANYLAEHLDIYSKLSDPLNWESTFGDDLSSIDPQKLIETKASGDAGSGASRTLQRMSLLKVSEQEKVIQEIGELYANEIQRLNEMGENDLEITELPLKAKTLHKEVWKQGAEPGGDNAFADNTYIEKVNMAILKKPMKASEVKASQKGLTGGKTWEEYKTEKKSAVKEYFDQKIADETQRYEERAVKAATKAKEKYIKDGKKGQEKSGMTDEQIEKNAEYQYETIYKQEKDKLDDVVKNLKGKAGMFERVLDTFDTEQAFVLPTDMNNPNELSGFGNSYGRLIDIKITDNFSPNASSVSFATLDGRRKITFPIAGKVGSGENKADIIGAIDNMTKQSIGMGDSHLRVLNQNFDNWDKLTSNESRKDGYIVTGNLMQALVDSKDQGLGGQLVKYTTDTGEVKTGILMPDRFDPKGLTTDAPINSVSDKLELSSWLGGIDEVTSSDGEVNVKRIDNYRGNFYELRVPKSKAKGGKYFLDEDLLKLVNGNNFETRGNNMLAEFKPDQLKPVLDRLSKMGVKVQEERKTTDDEGTHFREDRGLQYSKTDTKDVKNSRIIPEDVDKNVSSQIEKSYDVEVNRLFGHYLSPNQKRFVDETANDYASRSLHDEYYVDEETKEKKTVRGLDSAYKFWNDKVTEFEQKYGINRNTDISRLEEESRKAFANSFGEGRNSGRSSEQTNRYQGKDGYSMGGTGSGRDKASLPTPEEIFGYQCDVLERESVLRAYSYHKERARILSEKYGIDSGGWIQPETIEKIFNDFNTDKNLKVLFDRIKDQVNDLGIYFGEVYGEEKGTDGFYRHDSFNDIRLNIDGLLTAARTRQDFASVILHEMLHPLTSDIIAMYQNGHSDKLTKSQAEAAKNVVDIYNRLKSLYKEKGWKEPYALTNPREMMTELANPSWREALQGFEEGRSIWRKVLDSIRKFFGFAPTRPGLSDLNKALDNVLNNFGKEQFDFATRHSRELFGKEPQGHKVTDPEEIKRLEEEPKIKVYRAMQVIDGKLYPPMAAYADGKLVEANELGKWIKADEMPDSKNTVYKYKGTTTTIPKDRAVKGEDGIWRDSKNGAELAVGEDGNPTWYFKLQKGKGATGKKLTDVPAAYNPYWHTSYSPLNDQFKSAWIRPNVVVVECEVPAGELTSGYRAEHAKDPVGMTPWTSGVVTKQLVAKGHEGRKVMLSRWCKPVRIVPDEEVAAKIKDFIGDYDVEIPENVVTPRQKVELEKLGVKIGAPEKGMNKNEQIAEAIKLGLQVDNTVLSEDGTKFRTNYGDGNYPASSVESHVEKVAQKTGAKVNMVSSVDEITNKAAKAAVEEGRKITGWYDEKTGEVHLYMPNIHDRYTAEKTIWHEVVGHKGMRELFGEDRFNQFLRDVWYDLDKPENAELKKLVDEERKFNPLNIYDAIEEGIARLAEDGNGEAGFWNGIKNKVSDFLHEIGYRISPNTKDVKYLLWLSKNLQKNPNDPYWKLRAEAVKYRLDHDRVPAVVERNGMFYGNDGKIRSMENMTKSEWNEATDGQIHFRTTPSAGTALDRYHRSLDEHGYMFTESYMDNMLSLKKLMNAIVPDKKIEDIASSENPYMLQNTMQGAMSDAAQMFERNVMKPLDKAMAGVLDAFDGKKDDEKIRNFNLYMITKHGLERNRVFFVRDFIRQMRMDDKKKQDADILENRWGNEKERLDNELNAGNIDLKEYYRQMDEFISNEIAPDYKAGEHDYSGIHAIQEVAKSSDPYDDAEAIQSVMDSEAKMESIKKGAVKDYWDKVKAATQYSIDTDYKNGLISRELYGHVSDMFNWYVPLRKYDEATAEDTYGYITEQGDPKSYIGSTIMRARGHKYLSETNVLAQIGAMGNRAIKNGGMNAIRQAFARFVRNNSNNNLITEVSVWYEKDPMTGIVYERYPDIPEDATPDEINQIVSDFNTDMKAKAAQGLASKVYRRGSIGYKFQRAENKSQHIVDVKIAGRTHSFIINGNPRAAQALNGLLEHKNDTLAGRVTASISRKMAQLCTSYNPEFVMRNMIKDFEFASTNLLAKEGFRYTKLFEQYYAKVGIIEGIRNSKIKDFADTGGFGLFAKYRNGTLDTNDKVQRYFKEFMENGGETGWVQIKNMKDWTKEYKLHVKGERNKVQKVGKGFYNAIFKNLENINEIAENLARFSTYCASRDYGRSVIRSVYDAKVVSTNFNRHGSGNAIYSFKNGEMGAFKTARKNIYGFTAAWFRNSSMFFNAGIQSTNLLIKNFKNNKAGTIGYIASAPFISGMAMALLNNFIISNEDEKDRKGVKDPYGELPDYIRRNNLCVYIGGGEFVTIPLAIEERAFYGLGDLAAGMTFSKNISSQKMPNLTENKDIDKYLNPFMDAVGCMSQLVPVADYLGNSSFGKHPWQETIKAVAPSATAPFLEWVYNSDWKGAPIQRDNKFDENQPSWMLAYKGTPEWMINMNKKVNAMTNDVAPGNEDMKGNDFLDAVTNPSALHHFYGSYFGGAATFVERVGGLVKNGKDTETKDIPFLRSLLYTPSEQSSLQRTKSKWYNYKDEMKKTMANVDRLKSKNVPIDKRITNIGEYYHFQNSKEAAKVRVIDLAEKQMDRWKKMRDKASDTESINFANQNIDRIMMDAVNDLDKLN